MGDLLQKAEDLSDHELDTRAQVHVVPDVTDVLVSPTFVVTEFLMVFRVALIGKMLNHSPFLSPKSEHIVLHVRKKRGGMKAHK